MQWTDLIDWCFKGLVAGCTMYGVSILSKMRQSIDTLNTQVATIIEKDEWHEKWLSDHDEELKEVNERLRIVESK